MVVFVTEICFCRNFARACLCSANRCRRRCRIQRQRPTGSSRHTNAIDSYVQSPLDGRIRTADAVVVDASSTGRKKEDAQE